MYIKMFGTTIPQKLTTWAYLLPKSSGNSVYERIGYKRGRLGRSSKELQGYCVWDNRVCVREREREREMIGRNCFVQKSFCAKKKNFIAQFIDVVFLLLRLRVPLDVSNNIVSERERKRAKNCSNQKRIVTKLTRSTLKIQSFSTEHSPMGEASQYNWSPVLQVWI